MSVKNSSENKKRPLRRLQFLITAITLAAVVTAVFLGNQTYHETREMTIEQFNRQQLTLARSAAAGISSYCKELSVALSSLAQLPSIQQMRPECLQEMQHTYWGFPPRTSMRILDSDGVLRFIYPFDGWRGELVGQDYGKETFFQEARETGRVSVSGLAINEQGEARIRVAVPLYLTHETETVKIGDEVGNIVTPIDLDEPEAGKFQGVLVGSFDPYIITRDFISPILSGETGYAWLLSEAGIFLAHHEEAFIGQNAFEARTERNHDISYAAIEQIQRRMVAGEEGTDRYVSGWHREQEGEIEKLIAYTPVHINDHIWSVAVCAPVSEVEEIIHVTKRSALHTLALIVLVLITGGLSLLTVSHRWSRSLEQEVARRTRELLESISEREQAEEKYRALFETAQDAIFLSDETGKFVDANRKACESLGYSKEELLKLGNGEIDADPRGHEAFLKARDGLAETITFKVDQRRKDGTLLPVEITGSFFTSGGQRISLAIARDITERKRAEERLRETRDYLENLINHANAPIILWDSEFRITRINYAFEHLAGYTADEIMGQKLGLLFPKASRDESLGKIERALSGEYWESAEIPILRQDGDIRVAIWNSANIYAKDGETLLSTIAQGIDITGRKQAEESLQKSMEEYHTTLDSMADTIHVVGPDLKVILFNTTLKKWCKELGLTTDIIGKTVFEIFPFLHSRIRDEFRQVFETGRILITEEINKIGDQQIITETRKIPIFEKDQVVRVITVVRDITERVRSEEERARAEDALRQHAERLRTLRDIDQAISSTLALPEVLDQLTRALTMTMGINRCSIWLLDESGEFLQGRGYGAQPGEPDVESIRIPRTEPMVAHLLETGQPLVVRDVNDPAYANVVNTEYTTAFHIRAFLAVPLVLRDQVTGLLVLDDTRTARIFQPEEIELAQNMATRAAIAIENARLFEEVRAGREQLRDLTSYLQTAREEERAYIAREIHDEFGQSLTALKMDLAWLTKRLPSDNAHLMEKSNTMSNLIDSTIQTVRRVATRLRPGPLDDLGLVAAIEWQAQEWAERTGVNCDLYLGDEDIVLNLDLATTIFRIFQESLTNIARHAQATEVRVELKERPDELMLIVRDNGGGITPAQVSDSHSLGLIGMRERAHSWGGDVTFQSVAGQGTTVTVRMPRTDAQEERK